MNVIMIFQAGFGLGIGFILVMAAISLYTAYRVLKSIEGICKFCLSHIACPPNL